MSRPAVFLDRDGTLNVRPAEHRWIASPNDFTWLPGAARGAARLATAGYVLAVVSNQRGISSGVVNLTTLRALEALIQRGLAEHGCQIEAFAYCPHEAVANCNCRKPRPGMIVSLTRDLDIDPGRSWMIGDSPSDVLAGQAAGCRTALIGPVSERCEPDLVAPSLDAASTLVLLTEKQTQARAEAPPASNSSTRA